MKRCVNCGSFIQDDAKFCTYCGGPQSQPESVQQYAKEPSPQPVQPAPQPAPQPAQKQTPQPEKRPPRSHSWMGVLGFVLSLTVVLAPIGLILCILDFILKKKHRHGLTIAGTVIGGICTLIMATALIVYITDEASYNYTPVPEPEPSIFMPPYIPGDTKDYGVLPDETAEIYPLDGPGYQNTVESGEYIVPLGNASYNISYTSFDWAQSSYSPTEYLAVVEVENTGNTNLYLEKGTFDFEDDAGHLVTTSEMVDSGPTVIYPGEKGYFYNLFNYMDPSVDTGSGLNLVPRIIVKEATGPYYRYDVSDTGLRDTGHGYVTVTCRVTNNTDVSDMCHLCIILRNAEGRIIGMGDGYLNEVEPGATESFEFDYVQLGPNVEFGDVDSVEVVAEAWYWEW